MKCIFITDKQQPGDTYHYITSREAMIFKDMFFQDLKGGFEFGRRFLYHMVWAMLNYNFQYFMRIDDDYFLCMDRLLYELPMPPQLNFHWGFMHIITGVTRPEESIILFSKDVIQRYLSQDPLTMKCLPIADQMIPLWTLEVNLPNIFHHDPRLHNAPIVKLKPILHNIDNICDKYIGIHGSYEDDIKKFWEKRGVNNKYKGNLITNSFQPPMDASFKWEIFDDKWRFEPKLCIKNPTWDTSHLGITLGSYGGREETDVGVDNNGYVINFIENAKDYFGRVIKILRYK